MSSSSRRFVAVPFVGLSAESPFQAQGENYAIPVSVEIAALGHDFRFQADITDALGAGLHELSNLTQGIGLGDFVPKDFHLEDVLRMNELSFDFNPSATNKLTAVSVGVKNTNSWKILHLTLKQGSHRRGSEVLIGGGRSTRATRKELFAALRGELSLAPPAGWYSRRNIPISGCRATSRKVRPCTWASLFADFLGPGGWGGSPRPRNALAFLLFGWQPTICARRRGGWLLGDRAGLAPLGPVGARPRHRWHPGEFRRAVHHRQRDFTGLRRFLRHRPGWTFKGEFGYTISSGIKLAQMVNDIVQFFGVAQPVDVPEFLTAWIVQKVALQFNTKKKISTLPRHPE